MQSGQIDVEAVLAIIFSLAILLIVLAYTNTQTDELKRLESLEDEKIICNKISAIISLANSNDTNERAEFFLEKNATITGNTITVGNHYCYFLGSAQNAALSAGKIMAKESSGVAVLENI
ncbi:MAG: hypothetical protein HYW50_01945 [Candidatus Diapherotrites archaeon]|nr:hypothetical protein [Candidatus Diapherotrites archaeon]